MKSYLQSIFCVLCDKLLKTTKPISNESDTHFFCLLNKKDVLSFPYFCIIASCLISNTTSPNVCLMQWTGVENCSTSNKTATHFFLSVEQKDALHVIQFLVLFPPFLIPLPLSQSTRLQILIQFSSNLLAQRTHVTSSRAINNVLIPFLLYITKSFCLLISLSLHLIWCCT